MKPNKPRSGRSLITTLAITFFTLSVVILLVNGSLALVSSILTNHDAISSKQKLIAQDAAKTVSKYIQDKFSSLEIAVKFAKPVNGSAETRKTILDSLLGQDPAFRQFVLFDNRGQQLAQDSRVPQTLSSQFITQLKVDVLTQTAKGQRYISQVYIDDVSNEPLIAIAIPVKNVLGDFQGTLVAEVNLKFMWDLVGQLQVGQTGYAYVVDNTGNLIAFGFVSHSRQPIQRRELQPIPACSERPLWELTFSSVHRSGPSSPKCRGRRLTRLSSRQQWRLSPPF